VYILNLSVKMEVMQLVKTDGISSPLCPDSGGEQF
jgi:hypothetical protein